MPRANQKGSGNFATRFERQVAIGATIGIVIILFAVSLFYCWKKRDNCFLCSRVTGRRTKRKLEHGKFWYRQDPEMQRHHPRRTHQQRHTSSEPLLEESSTASSAHLHVNDRIELPFFDSTWRATTAQTVVEVDGSPKGPVELPVEPAASGQSRCASANTLYQYTSRSS